MALYLLESRRPLHSRATQTILRPLSLRARLLVFWESKGTLLYLTVAMSVNVQSLSGHQLGNSIAVLRQYHALGVRYVTLTHVCHNAFADSCGMEPGMIPLHGGITYAISSAFALLLTLLRWGSQLGRSLIDEMNRLGVLVDLSHTSDPTAAQAFNHSKAPVIWS